MSDSYFRRLLRAFSQKSRMKKFELFDSLIRPRPQDCILDIGASGDVFSEYTFGDFYPHPERVTGLGYDWSEVISARQQYPRSRYVTADGCLLPFPDKSFDIVFSNAVIEHILGPGRQQQFAKEIMRVGRSWFITTPNYWYPFETHHHLPLFQFLPRALQLEYNRRLGTHIPKNTVQDLALLSARRLTALFPGSDILKVRVTFWPETLVAYHVGTGRVF
jgi:ubiquinone/menaquinone biosynthesis C-methylase UbiE